ncbi:MAG TPA: NADH:flavin oxidoreductase [Planctomycetota bacterium]|nr:NADH:flavin oxidoreductase [Planctomycetota bacterium]
MKLFEPIDVGPMRLENRVVLPAMVTRLSGEDGFVNQDIMDRYVRLAKGEPGLLVIEAMAIHGAKSGQLLRFGEDRFIEGHRELLRRMRAVSPSKVVPQIIHFLKLARSGWRQKVMDLSVEEIKLIVRQYGDAAERARRTGYDGVELHMAHAYTVSSFLSLRNLREDDYGGSLENRMRLMSEILIDVRRRVGGDFPMGVRFDGEECITDGYGLNDSAQMALRMSKLGADWISVSAGGKFEDALHKPGQAIYPYTGYSGDRCMPPRVYQDGYNVYLGAGIKAHLNQQGLATPVVATGKIRTAELAERILASGQADLIGLARTLLADPDWPKKVRDGREDKVVRCISINVCKSLDENFRKVRCYLWPRGSLHAPESADTTPPSWPESGAGLRVFEEPKGHVRLSWSAALDGEGVYGYWVERSAEGGPWEIVSAVRADMHTTFQDSTAVAGTGYRYRVRAYDLAGNKSAPSNIVEISLRIPALQENP